MPRFYFHIGTTDEVVTDCEGFELPTLSACHEHALKIIRGCLPFVRSDPRRWWIEIDDARGKTVLIVLYPRHLHFGWRAWQQRLCG